MGDGLFQRSFCRSWAAERLSILRMNTNGLWMTALDYFSAACIARLNESHHAQSRRSADLFFRSAARPRWTRKSRGPKNQVRATLPRPEFLPILGSRTAVKTQDEYKWALDDGIGSLFRNLYSPPQREPSRTEALRISESSLFPSLLTRISHHDSGRAGL